MAVTERYHTASYFDQNLLGAQADQSVLRDLLADRLPDLARHLQAIDIEISTVTLNWFLAIFFDAVPFPVSAAHAPRLSAGRRHALLCSLAGLTTGWFGAWVVYDLMAWLLGGLISRLFGGFLLLFFGRFVVWLVSGSVGYTVSATYSVYMQHKLYDYAQFAPCGVTLCVGVCLGARSLADFCPALPFDCSCWRCAV